MNYYFLGIGGIGMSALARFFHRRGDRVAGYDRTPSPLTQQLESEGIAIHYGDCPAAIPQDVDVAVYTPAVPSSLAEMQALRQAGVPLIKRSQMLGELTRGKRCIAVAGSHGKTTTSTLIAHLLHDSSVGCSAFLGGISKNFGSNLFVDPSSPYVVVEADEYDRSFLQLHPTMAVVTATDPDHLDIYGTHECMMEAYAQFCRQVAADGLLVLKRGIFRSSNGSQWLPYEGDNVERPFPAPVSVYDTASAADYWVDAVRAVEGNILFDLHTPSGCFEALELRSAPLVNVENAVAASAVALACGVTEAELRAALLSFEGVQRRFDCRLQRGRLVYIDDYAHHPAELRATIQSVRFLYPGRRVVGVFQPHLYSRTRDFAPQFAEVLALLDEVVLMPIYPAREEPIPGISSQLLYDLIPISGKHLCPPSEVAQLVSSLRPDVVLTLGAGDIDRLVPQIEKTLTDLAL